jgi:hypothetical protein
MYVYIATHTYAYVIYTHTHMLHTQICICYIHRYAYFIHTHTHTLYTQIRICSHYLHDCHTTLPSSLDGIPKCHTHIRICYIHICMFAYVHITCMIATPHCPPLSMVFLSTMPFEFIDILTLSPVVCTQIHVISQDSCVEALSMYAQAKFREGNLVRTCPGSQFR